MNRTVGCIIARTNSTRLKKKVLKTMGKKKMIEQLIERMKISNNFDALYLCTSTHADDAFLLEVAEENGINAYAGSELSVIDRLIDVGEKESATNVVRILGDNPLTDPYIADQLICSHNDRKADFTTMEFLPRGALAQIIRLSALKDLYSKMNPDESQYLTLYINNPKLFKCNYLIPEPSCYKPFLTFSVDREKEYNDVNLLVNQLGIRMHLAEYIKIAEEKNICQLDKHMAIKVSESETISYAEHLKWKEERIKGLTN